MSSVLRRVGYALLILLWLVVMAFPIIAFVLAARGEIRLGPSTAGHVRLFLLQEEDAQGVGVEWTRPASSEACYKTSVNYYLWKAGSAALNTGYCLCYESKGSSSVVSASCPEP